MQPLHDFLQNLFEEIFELEADEFDDQLSYEDTPEWDSLGHMKMVAALTKEYGVEFDIEEVISMENVARIKQIVEEKLAA